MQAYDHFVVVVLALLAGGFQRAVPVGPGDAWDEEVHRGPQLQEGVVQGRVDQEQALPAAQEGGLSPGARAGRAEARGCGGFAGLTRTGLRKRAELHELAGCPQPDVL